MDLEKLAKLKQLLDSGAITQEEFEQQKREFIGDDGGEIKKKGNKGLIIGIAAVAVLCIGIIASNSPESTTPVSENQAQTTALPTNSFQGECPIDVATSMYDNIIGVPELKCTITNKSDKNIVAVKLHFEPKNVYGEAVNSIFTEKKLYTDDVITAGGSVTKTWQMLDQEVKSGDLYIYSVYFEDTTEWGNKDAADSDIKKYGYKLNAKY